MVNDFLPPNRKMGTALRSSRGPSFHVHKAQQFKSSSPDAAETQLDNVPVTPFAAPEAVQRDIGHTASVGAGQPPRQNKQSLKDRLRSLSKKQWIIIASVGAILIIGGGVGAFMLFHHQEAPRHAVVKKTPVVPPPSPVITTVPSKLTGLPVDPSVNEKQVTAIMIENSQDARPQSGLNQAGVVFEAIAEGGITRFATVFLDNEPEYVGPVRSVRPYYIQWLMGFDAAIAHVGGSNEALAKIRSQGKDLDQFFNPSAYWRVTNRFAPHNMYTSIPKLHAVEDKKGYTKSNFTGFSRKAKDTPSTAPNARTIDFNISGAIYNPHYDYDAPSNTYKRSEGGKPHMDEKSNTQLAPKVVIGLVMPQGRNGIYTTYQTIGSGEAVVFQDGTATPATWHKSDERSNFTFTDTNGADLKLNPGQTWLSVVGSRDRITYAP